MNKLFRLQTTSMKMNYKHTINKSECSYRRVQWVWWWNQQGHLVICLLRQHARIPSEATCNCSVASIVQRQCSFCSYGEAWYGHNKTDHQPCQCRSDSSINCRPTIVCQEDTVGMAWCAWREAVCGNDGWSSNWMSLAISLMEVVGSLWWLLQMQLQKGEHLAFRKVHTHQEVSGLTR